MFYEQLRQMNSQRVLLHLTGKCFWLRKNSLSHKNGFKLVASKKLIISEKGLQTEDEETTEFYSRFLKHLPSGKVVGMIFQGRGEPFKYLKQKGHMLLYDSQYYTKNIIKVSPTDKIANQEIARWFADSHGTSTEMLRRRNAAFDARQQALVVRPPVAEQPDVLREQTEPSDEVNGGLTSLLLTMSRRSDRSTTTSRMKELYHSERVTKEMEEMEQNLLSVLSRPPFEKNNSTDFIMDYFKFACTCRASRTEPKKVIGDCLPHFHKYALQLMPIFDSELYTSVNDWGREHARPLRCMRSGLEFFKEDIVDETSPVDLKEIFKNFMEESDALDELDSKLEDYAGNRAEWDTGADPVDLRGVPSTHTWWSELERNDSVAKFGT